MSTSTACDAYGNGWCCTSGASTISFGVFEVTIFSALLSFTMVVMLFYTLLKIGLHYYHLQKPDTKSEEVKPFVGSSTASLPYKSFANNLVAPTASVKGFTVGERTIQETDSEVTDQDEYQYSDEEGLLPMDHLLPNRESRTTLIQIYQKYEKNLGIESKFTGKKRVVVRRSALRGFHFIYLLLLCVWFLVQTVIMLTGSPTSFILKMMDYTVYFSHAFLDNLIIITTFFPSDNRRNITISVLITIAMALVASCTVFLYSFDGLCHQCSFFFPAPQAFYTYLFFFVWSVLCLILHYTKCRVSPRRTVVPWVWFMLVIYGMSSFGSGVVYIGMQDIGFCVMNVVMLLYAFAMAPLLHFVLLRDSIYISKKENDSTKGSNPLAARVYDNLKRHAVGWIPYEEIEVQERLGLGAAGEVYKGEFLQTPVAIKRLFDNQSQALEDFFKEVTLMSKLSHPNILLFIGVCVRDNGDRFIITEMMERGSVFDLIHPNLSFSTIRDPDADNRLTSKRIHSILLQTARGLSYLHSFRPPIVHRDLKSHNLLVGINWNLKVGDFGLSRPQSADLMTAAGTPQWTAPEVIRHDYYTIKADVYSFSIIIYELLSGKIPYVEIGPMAAAHKVAYEGLRPVFPSYCDPIYVNFAKECWSEEEMDRPTFPDIVRRLEQMDPPILPQVVNM